MRVKKRVESDSVMKIGGGSEGFCYISLLQVIGKWFRKDEDEFS